jgi:hypothetical protein
VHVVDDYVGNDECPYHGFRSVIPLALFTAALNREKKNGCCVNSL